MFYRQFRFRDNKKRKVYVLISDGESAEGSVWEALRFIKESNLSNIEVYVNVNGYAAYDKVDVKYLVDRLESFLPEINIQLCIEFTSTQYSSSDQI